MRLEEAYRAALARLKLEPTKHALLADGGEQILWHCRDGQPVASCRFARSANPPSEVEGSEGTPRGLHCVTEKYGDAACPGTVFVGRRDTGETYAERADAGPEQRKLVTTRILRLRGLEPGFNAGPGCDSFARYIYIHGTNFPARLYTNFSAGCLLLADADLVALYAAVPPGSHVWMGF